MPTSGYYYLTEDVNLGTQCKIGEKTTANLYLCTNGFDITSTIPAGNTFGAIRVYAGSNLTITNCKAQVKDGRLDTSNAAKTSTLSGAVTTTSAGAMIQVYAGEELALAGVEFKGNESQSSHATWGAGAVLCVGAAQKVTAAYTAFNENRTTHTGGGALTLFGGTADIRNTTFADNYAATNGGAINMVNVATALTLVDCTFTGNGVDATDAVVTDNGGAIYVLKGSVNATNVTFKENKAVYTGETTGNGGAVYLAQGTKLTGTNVTFTSNAISTGVEGKTGNGAAIYATKAEADLTGSQFTTNAATNGGAIYIYNGSKATLTNTTMTGNSNAGAGGSAITVENNSPTLTLNSCNITGNTNAGEGMRAAIVVIDSATFTVTGNTVVDNNTNKGKERNILLRNWSAQPKLTVGQLTEGANISVETADRTATVALEDPDTILTKNFTGDYKLGWISYSDGRSVGYNTTDGFYFVAAHTHDGVTYRPWSSTDALPQDGNYYLMANVTLNEAQKLSKATLKLCLNGKTVTGDVIAELGEAANLVVVSEGGALAGKLALAADSATVTSDCPIALELNGYDTIVNASNVTLTDSATDEGKEGGKVYGNCNVASNVTENGKIRYVVLDSADGTYKTANAVRVVLKRVNVRPSAAGMYFTTEFKFNKNVVDAGATYGVVLSTHSAIDEEFMTETNGESLVNLWTVGTPEAGQNFISTGNSCLVKNILSEDADAATNSTRGATEIYAHGYVKIGDVVIMAENNGTVKRSLKGVMQELDPSVKDYADGIGELSQNGAKALNFYETWQAAMADWNLTNLANALTRKNAA